MSAVIEFPGARLRAPAPTASGATADIIIFPGVRVERLAFDLAERLPMARNASPATVRVERDFY